MCKITHLGENVVKENEYLSAMLFSLCSQLQLSTSPTFCYCWFYKWRLSQKNKIQPSRFGFLYTTIWITQSDELGGFS